MIKSILVKTVELKETDMTSDMQPDFIVKSVNEMDGLF